MHVSKKSALIGIATGVMAGVCSLLPSPVHAAQVPAPAALSGRVSSQEEGEMEGVLVSARKQGSTVTVTVVSDAQGRYSFPRNRLEPGQYSLHIRAVGYELNDPDPAEVTTQKTAQLDLKLRKTADLASQMTNAELLWSAPGTEEQKKFLLTCVGCHTLQRIFRSHYNAGELTKTAQRMSTYYEGTIPERPQLKPVPPNPPPPTPRITPEQAEYLNTVNLSANSQWQYPLKTQPRPKGKATQVIITEYDLPRPRAMPHDTVVDSEGLVWYSDHGQQYVGRLDPKSGEVVEYSLPILRLGFPTGLHFLELDPEGNIWVTMGTQGAVAKLDRKTQKFQTWSLPKGGPGEAEQSAFALLLGHLTVDGKVWVGEPDSKRIQRLDVRSGEWEREPIDPYREIPKNSPAAARRHFFYDLYSDSHKNVYLTDNSSEFIDKIDAKTGKVTFYPTPSFDSAPRRGHIDKADRLWFGEYQSNRIAMFDPKSEQVKEWEVPTPFSGPYDVVVDRNGYAWTGGMTSDRIARLNTKTGEIVEYLLPRSTNIRRVEVDNSTNPVSFWTGDNHGASIVKLEPLE